MFAISSIGILALIYACLDTKITILSELEAEILKISISVGHFGKWLTISCRSVFAISSIGILAPKYVCLDTKITILSELEAGVIENLFWSAILENGRQIRVDKCL